MQNLIEQRYHQVKQKIRQITLQCNRHDRDISLLAVSKKHSAESILKLYQLGQLDFGENYLQEAQQKIEELKGYPIRWHFIGPIQSNKTNAIARNFDWVHSVDRIKIAQRLNRHCEEMQKTLSICLQINLNDESQKSGFIIDEIDPAIETIKNLAFLKLQGFMAIPKAGNDFTEQCENFAQLRHLLEKSNQLHNLNMKVLSMGMSNDMQAAIMEGSTCLRIGTDIFGKRD